MDKTRGTHCLCQAQLMAAESPAQPPRAALRPGEAPGMFSLWLAPTQPLGVPISSALPGENKPNLVLLGSAGA